MISKHCIKSWIYPFVALFAGLILVQLRVMGIDFSRIPGDLGDARFNLYLLEHSYQFTTGQWVEYWNAGFFYPELETIAYSDNLLGSSPFYTLGRVIGFSRGGAFQLWIILMAAFNFIAAYCFLKGVSKKSHLSALGAFIYAFSLVLFSQMYHAQTMPRFAFPLMLLFLFQFHSNGKARNFILALWMLVWQFYCGIYLGFFSAFIIILYGLFSLIYHWKKYLVLISNWRSLFIVCANIGAAIVVLFKLMEPYIRRAENATPYSLERILVTVPKPGSYFYSVKETLLWSFLSETGDDWDFAYTQTLFIGGVAVLSVLACSLFLVKRDFRRLVFGEKYLAFVITAFLSLLFFMKFGNFSLYSWLINIPGFGALRSLDRMINVQLLFVAMALVAVLSYLFKKRGPKMVFTVVLILLVIDNYKLNTQRVTFDKRMAQERVDRLSEKIVDAGDVKAFCYQPDTLLEKSIHYHLDAMLAGQEVGVRTVNGYSATSPYGYTLFWRELNDAGRQKWFKIRGVDTTGIVVIH